MHAKHTNDSAFAVPILLSIGVYGVGVMAVHTESDNKLNVCLCYVYGLIYAVWLGW